jgi:hypothetical protein
LDRIEKRGLDGSDTKQCRRNKYFNIQQSKIATEKPGKTSENNREQGAQTQDWI